MTIRGIQDNIGTINLRGGQRGGSVSGGGRSTPVTGGNFVSPRDDTSQRNQIQGGSNQLLNSQAGQNAVNPSMQALSNFNPQVSQRVEAGLSGANLRSSASQNLDQLNQTGLLTNTSGITQAAQQQGQQAFGDMSAQIQSMLAASGGLDSSASVARLSDAASRIGTNIGIEGLRAGVGAQESANARRAGAVNPALGEAGLAQQGFASLGGLQQGAGEQFIRAQQGAGQLGLGGAGLDQNAQIAGLGGLQSLLTPSQFVPDGGGQFAGNSAVSNSAFAPNMLQQNPVMQPRGNNDLLQMLARRGQDANPGLGARTPNDLFGQASMGATSMNPELLQALLGGQVSYAEGGMVPGPSQPEDVVPAMLTGGEGVIPRDMTQALLYAQSNDDVLMVGRNIQKMLMEDMNAQKKAAGGLIHPTAPGGPQGIPVFMNGLQAGQFGPPIPPSPPTFEQIHGLMTPQEAQAFANSPSFEEQHGILTPEQLAQQAQFSEDPTRFTPGGTRPNRAALSGFGQGDTASRFGFQQSQEASGTPKFDNFNGLFNPPEHQLQQEFRQQQLRRDLDMAHARHSNAVADLLAANPLDPNYNALVQQAQLTAENLKNAGGQVNESDKLIAESIKAQQLLEAQKLLSAEQIKIQRQNVEINKRQATVGERNATTREQDIDGRLEIAKHNADTHEQDITGRLEVAKRNAATGEKNAESNARRSINPVREALGIAFDINASPEQRAEAIAIIESQQKPETATEGSKLMLSILRAWKDKKISDETAKRLIERTGSSLTIEEGGWFDDDEANLNSDTVSPEDVFNDIATQLKESLRKLER